jgi:ribosomal protein S13
MRKVEPKHSFKLNYSSPIITESLQEGADKKLFIIGNAISSGASRNKTSEGKKIIYKDEELQNAASKMVGIPLILNHESDDVRNIVGIVTEAKFENGSVPYKARIDIGEEDIVRKLANGFINRVSIGADYERLEEKSDSISPLGLEILELSLVPIAGIPTADISQVICEKYEVSNMAETTKESDTQLAEMKTQIEKLTSEKTVMAEKLKSSEEASKVAEAKASEFSKMNDTIKELKEKVTAITNIPKGVVETGKENRLELKAESVKGMLEIYSPSVKDAEGKWLY